MDKKRSNFCLPKVTSFLPNTDKKVKNRGKSEENVNKIYAQNLQLDFLSKFFRLFKRILNWLGKIPTD